MLDNLQKLLINDTPSSLLSLINTIFGNISDIRFILEHVPSEGQIAPYSGEKMILQMSLSNKETT